MVVREVWFKDFIAYRDLTLPRRSQERVQLSEYRRVSGQLRVSAAGVSVPVVSLSLVRGGGCQRCQTETRSEKGKIDGEIYS